MRVTDVPPVLIRRDGQWCVELIAQLEDGTPLRVISPIGDGCYFVQQAIDKVVLPALGRAMPHPRPLRQPPPLE